MLFTVVTPAFNASRHLREAIESVLAQSYPQWEMIVVDDGSADATAEIASEYLDDPRMRLICCPENRGVGASRNIAIASARSAWIAFLDADDTMLPNRLERQLAFIHTHPTADAIGSRVEYIDANGCRLGTSELRPYTDEVAFRAHIARGGTVSIKQSAATVRRETLLRVGGYRPEFLSAGDYDLWHRLIEAGFVILEQNDVLTKRRMHAGAMMSRHARRVWDMSAWVDACATARRTGRPEPSFEEFRRSIQGRGFLQYLNYERKVMSKIYYRHAAMSLAERQARGLWHLTVCMLTAPIYTVRRMVMQLALRITG